MTTTETQHTPGPWGYGVNGTGLYHQWQITTADGMIHIADIRHNGHNLRHGVANARFIAAAPEMAKTLRAAAEELEHGLMSCDKEDKNSRKVLDRIEAVLRAAGVP